ncbi:hypothetical protein [Sphingobacterium deserti]|uniref:Uncharacterized protein n=1 Tax=Sphingobacterium deserti TaxID=1229276 RepID=A0A0B8T0P6_9SPHI|nr:hypothetical protein [Sphingobacterium deserti]KGE14242.1 hypothetical protein DI53_2072 [Sphingobacterium deserti]
MIKTLIIGILLCIGLCSVGQVAMRPEINYPEGIYLTKEDFIKKTPSDNKEVVVKSIALKPKTIHDSIPDHCMFYYKESDKKVKNVFAISHQGNLYFQALSILKNCTKKDKTETTHALNSFCRVLIGGSNYLYTELDLANSWKQGLGYGLGGAAGGAIAASAIKGKGLVWDFKNEEFNIFRHCKDYNEFMTDVYPDGVQKCEGKQPDMVQVRATMELIK